MIQVAAPTRVRERLAGADVGPRRVVHASATAIYVDLDGWCLGLVSASATRVPCGLWSTLPDLTRLVGAPVSVADGTLTIGDHVVRIARITDARVRRVGRRAVPGTTPLVGGDWDLPADGHLTSHHVERLLGRGPGLTPLGDDVLAGWLVARTAAGQPDLTVAGAVRRRLGVTTLLSATLLDCAIRGEALPELTDWLADDSPVTTEALLAVGATSGAGLLTGAGLALTSLTTHRPGRAA